MERMRHEMEVKIQGTCWNVRIRLNTNSSSTFDILMFLRTYITAPSAYLAVCENSTCFIAFLSSIKCKYLAPYFVAKWVAIFLWTLKKEAVYCHFVAWKFYPRSTLEFHFLYKKNIFIFDVWNVWHITSFTRRACIISNKKSYENCR